MTTIDDLRLYVRHDEGEGPVIVLLHGINSNAACWRTVIDTIGPEYRVIAPDLLGFGESPKPDIEYTADQHTAVLDATLRDLGVTERFVLVGYSMGGNVAIRYAATHPDRLRRLFLLAAPFYPPPEVYSRASFGWHYVQASFYQWLWRFIGRQKERDTLLFGAASGPLQAQMGGFLKTDDVSAHWDRMRRNLDNTIARATFVDDLPRLTMPTVFALGVRDPIVRPDQTLALKRIKPALEIRRIVGLTADHMLLDKAPDTVAREILADEVRRLHVRFHEGSGDPVVLLPGLEDGRPWLPVAERLAGRREVVVLDALGFGDSPRPLSGHYTLEDHAAAVLATVTELFGDTPVTLVGQGFGGSVALACAASGPAHVREVVAFSPALVDPRTAGADQRADPAVARLLAARETYADLARDERAQRRSSERLEAEVVPALRGMDAMLTTDAEALLARQTGPVTLVLPAADAITPRDWLLERAHAEPGATIVEVDGAERFPYRAPDAAAAIVLGEPVPAAPTERDVAPIAPSDGTIGLARRLLGGANAQLVRHGVLALVGGLLLLLLPVTLPVRVVVWGFAVWLLIEAIQTIVGAVGLRRGGAGWLAWLLIGAVSLLFAGLLVVQDALAVGVLAWALAGWALVRGASALFAAWQAPRVPGQRVWLVAEGILALAVGVLLPTVPEFGARLLRWVLGAYLTASGAATLAIAWSVHRATVRRVRGYLGDN